jgi:hypothetical protein
MPKRHRLRRGRSYEHLRLLFGDVEAGTGMVPTGKKPPQPLIVRQEEPFPETGQALLRRPYAATIPPTLLYRKPRIIVAEAAPPYQGDVIQRGPNLEAFTNQPAATLLWWINSETNVWNDYAGIVPADPAAFDSSVLRMSDLSGGGHDVFGIKDPTTSGGQTGNYEQNAPVNPSTGIHHRNVHIGKIWRVGQPPCWLQSSTIGGGFGADFNFFTATGKWSYVLVYSGLVTNGILLKDGNATSGFGIGFGNPDVEHAPMGGDPKLWIGVKDGVGEESTGVQPNTADGTIIVTYDGSTGQTKYYTAGANLTFTAGIVTLLATFTQVGVTATGGFSLGNMAATTNGGSSNTRLVEQWSLLEAKVFSGILSSSQIQNLADHSATYWGV